MKYKLDKEVEIGESFRMRYFSNFLDAARAGWLAHFRRKGQRCTTKKVEKCSPYSILEITRVE